MKTTFLISSLGAGDRVGTYSSNAALNPNCADFNKACVVSIQIPESFPIFCAAANNIKMRMPDCFLCACRWEEKELIGRKRSGNQNQTLGEKNSAVKISHRFQGGDNDTREARAARKEEQTGEGAASRGFAPSNSSCGLGLVCSPPPRTDWRCFSKETGSGRGI